MSEDIEQFNAAMQAQAKQFNESLLAQRVQAHIDITAVNWEEPKTSELTHEDYIIIACVLGFITGGILL